MNVDARNGYKDRSRYDVPLSVREIIAAEIKIGEPYATADRIIAALIRNGVEL